MKKIVLGLFLITSVILASNSVAQKAYEKGKVIASKISTSTHETVRVQKCKHLVALDKSIHVNVRVDGYRGCEDEVFGLSKED